MTLLVGDEEHALLALGALDLVVLDDEFLLEHLDGVQLLRRLGLGQHDLAEVAFAQHRQEVEVLEPNAACRRLLLLLLLRDHLL